MSDYFRDWTAGKVSPWLRKDGKTRLFTLHLTHISSPLNADALWDSRTGGDPKMQDTSSKRTDLRLKQALHAHRFAKTAYKGGAPIHQHFVFSDVVVWIPDSIWRDADIEGGEPLFHMTERLRYQHNEAFAATEGYLGRPPNYAIMPLTGLPENEVICQFGMGVFLPNASDERTASLKVAKKGHEPCEPTEWIFFERAKGDDGKELEPTQSVKVSRPAGLYSKQTLLLLAGKLEQSALISPVWLDSTDEGEIILNTSAKPYGVYGDDKNIISNTPQRRGEQTSCQFSAKEDSHDTLTLLLDRAEPRKTVMDILRRASANPLPSGTVVEDDAEDFGGLTHIDEDDGTPDYAYCLRLTGIVLPKLGSSPAMEPLSHWLLKLDADGMPTLEGGETAWSIKGGRDPILQYNIAGEMEWYSLDLQTALPFPREMAVHLEVAESVEKQFAILPFRGVFSVPLSTQASILGRDLGDASKADVPLGLLKHASALFYRDGNPRGGLESLGLSGEHLQVKLEGRSLHLQQMGRSKTLVLQRSGGIRMVLTSKQPQTDLNPGEGILIGPFRFIFVEEFRLDRKD